MVALDSACSWLDDCVEVIRENDNRLGANHLYSVAALTDNSGNVVERYRYDAYGQRTVLAPDGVTTRTASSYNNQIGFTGRYLDKETGLWYFRARYYSGSLGRFVGRDFSSLSITGYDEDRVAQIAHNREFVHSEIGSSVYRNGYSMYLAGFVPNDMDWTGFVSNRDGEPCGIFEQWSTRMVIVDVKCWRRCEIQSSAQTWYCWFCSDPEGKGIADMKQMCRMVMDFKPRPLRPGRANPVFDTQWKDFWWFPTGERNCVVGKCGSGCDDKGVYY